MKRWYDVIEDDDLYRPGGYPCSLLIIVPFTEWDNFNYEPKKSFYDWCSQNLKYFQFHGSSIALWSIQDIALYKLTWIE